MIIKELNLKSYANITRILEKEEAIVERYESNNRESNASQYKISKAEYQLLEKELILWLRKIWTNKLPINSDITLDKANQFASELSYDFKPTVGYLRGLKRRNGFQFTEKHGESDSVDEESFDRWCAAMDLKINNYENEDIYNFDETGLFYRLLPSKTYSFVGKSSHGIKQMKTRITVGFLCNST